MSWDLFIPLVLVSLVVLGFEIAFAIRDHPAGRRAGLVAIFGIVLFPVAIVAHNVLAALIGGEEGVSFILALLIAPAATMLGTIGFVWSLAHDATARGHTAPFAVACAGLALFVGYTLFALVVASIEGGNPPYQAATEAFVLPIASLAIVGGVAWAALSLIRDRAAPPTLTERATASGSSGAPR